MRSASGATDDEKRINCVKKYREYILQHESLYSELHELEGKELGCWCYPKMCHGDVLVELLSSFT